MIRKIIVTLCIITLNLLYWIAPVQAETPLPTIVIVEVNVGTAANASQEFVELYNPGQEAVDITAWKLQKHALSGDLATGWQDYALFAAVLAPHSAIIQPGERLLVGTASYPQAVVPTKSATGALATSGGHLRLSRADATEVDRVSWDQGQSFAVCAENGVQALTPSFKRRLDGAAFVDTDTASDFCASIQETPGTDDSRLIMVPLEEPEDELSEELPPHEPGQGGEPPATDEPPEAPTLPTPRVYLKLAITELLPDPAPPQTDAEDEFIELYNPHATPADLEGYMLQTGTDFARQYTVGQVTIPPESYLSFRSVITHLSLTNSGGVARLLDPNGTVVSTTDAYGAAKPGQSWALINNTWQWTTQMTPTAINQLGLPPVKVTAASVKAAAKKVASTSTKPKSTPAPKAAAIKNPPAPKATPANGPAAITPEKPNYAILIAIGAAVVGYAVFEYRHELFNKGRQLRDYLGARFGNRGGS